VVSVFSVLAAGGVTTVVVLSVFSPDAGAGVTIVVFSPPPAGVSTRCSQAVHNARAARGIR
jgi:hypothetical protein